MNINTTSAFVAAQQAVLGFAALPADAAKSFFYTGKYPQCGHPPLVHGCGYGQVRGRTHDECCGGGI